MRKKQINTLPGFEKVKDRYWITDQGDVLSIDSKGCKTLAIKLSSPSSKSKGGYRTVCLCTTELTGKKRGYRNIKRNIYPRINRLVAMAFIPNPSNKETVDHIDGDIKNDNYTNLRWATMKENSRYANAKQVFMYDNQGLLVKKYESGADVKLDGFNQGHALAVARGVERSHKGMIFSYIELTKDEVIQRLSKPFYLSKDKRRK